MTAEYFDVLIVGAGLSGIGAAHHLTRRCPGKTYAILEARDAIGGTWDLFRYPGIRSDSDMYTLGYSFKPWREAKAIADGPSILNYVRETATEAGVNEHIRFRHKVRRAEWSSETASWTVEAEWLDTGETVKITCGFLYMCAGYYAYDAGYTPDFEGTERFRGKIVHPQHWPENLDYAGKRVVVIGSGATAVTIVPEMAKTAAHVTMLQRSPTYVVSRPAEDGLANWMRRRLPAMTAYGITRWKNVLITMLFFNLSRKKPAKTKERLINLVRDQLPKDYDVETHFTPRYNPWDQRLCLVPDADLFAAIGNGSAEVVTDHIETFTEDGLRLKSGKTLPADIVVTATGLRMQLMSGMEVVVDGRSVDLAKGFSYKGMMFSDVPNLASAFGYTNASWTLKADLTSEYVCRLLAHMDRAGADWCMPHLDAPDMEAVPWLDFSSGYVQRAMDKFPKQGTRAPWKVHQNYALDLAALRLGKLEDGVMRFGRKKAKAAA
ncbi:FAD-containing monooxygenase EthA [Caulobacter sp. D4A]|uniref:flavin-containing monooxygenase n=1 Tax=unclassified Caulobacter TaxID=2648921 RepID=UPI000D731C66|nr:MULTISPECIES: NAD(P)/FAD-dependent oxidoreductase [unclassified Caulobacter]PXA78943.1 FAD-containing monooxygenase EthA [Caulobacter sp. D4A]PXA95953.1 FAD-containing monooxygenase EthA [Caulobacter sp. D5]